MSYDTFIPPFYFPYEKDFRPEALAKWTEEHWSVAIIAVLAYGTLISYGPKYMMDKKAFELKFPLAIWNILLAVFSWIGALRTVPYLVHILMTKDYYGTVCTHAYDSWGSIDTTAFWIMLMNFSKIVELGDTVFIVLRKKPLIFLHWYHHITVLLFCWSAFSIVSVRLFSRCAKWSHSRLILF
jgi:elongation of very long chain fatty acids protein 6